LHPPRFNATVDQISQFDEIIDVRTPAEFAEDHVPGAVNRAVLSDEERSQVGTIYKQVSAFNGRRVGAALVSRNIAHHLETHFTDRPRSWRPLIYCWRGGKRSDAMVHILREIGWDAHRLDGGYRAYRRTVAHELPELARRFTLYILCGLTGSGKSRLLSHLETLGAQVLDLERLAVHRGSVLGNLPGQPQPAQKMFESRIWNALRSFDPLKPVFVESESKRIGTLQVPDRLLDAMRDARCVKVEASRALRVALLKEEYRHFLADPDVLGERLERLAPLHGRKTIQRWREAALAGDFDTLVGELLDLHYDPLYGRSIERNFPRHVDAQVASVAAVDDAAFHALAADVIASAPAREPETTPP